MPALLDLPRHACLDRTDSGPNQYRASCDHVRASDFKNQTCGEQIHLWTKLWIHLWMSGDYLCRPCVLTCGKHVNNTDVTSADLWLFNPLPVQKRTYCAQGDLRFSTTRCAIQSPRLPYRSELARLPRPEHTNGPAHCGPAHWQDYLALVRHNLNRERGRDIRVQNHRRLVLARGLHRSG